MFKTIVLNWLNALFPPPSLRAHIFEQHDMTIECFIILEIMYDIILLKSRIYKVRLFMSFGVPQVFYKSPTNILQVDYMSLTSLITTCFIGHGSWGMDHWVWVMGYGSWGMRHGSWGMGLGLWVHGEGSWDQLYVHR